MENKVERTVKTIAIIVVAVVAIIVAAVGIYRYFNSDLDKVKLYLSENFIDPDSLKYRNIRTFYENGEFKVCGEVNAKNSFGAYTGFHGFYGDVDKNGKAYAIAYESYDNPNTRIIFSSICK